MRRAAAGAAMGAALSVPVDLAAMEQDDGHYKMAEESNQASPSKKLLNSPERGHRCQHNLRVSTS